MIAPIHPELALDIAVKTIEGIQTILRKIADITGADSVHSVDAGSELVEEAGRAITDVVTSVKKVSDAIGKIAAATGE